LSENRKRAFSILLLTFSVTACGPSRLSLPSGPGTPAPDFASAYAAARASCESVSSIQAELGLSGRAAGQRVRGRILGGLVPGALRLEGVAPFGSPVFILVADGQSGTLLLSRERRVVRDAAPEEILNALIGLRLGADDLRALLSGCVKASAEAASARAYGPDWIAVDLSSGGTVYLNRMATAWRIVAGRYGGLEIDYPAFAGSRPSQITLRGADLNLGLALSQVEVNGDLPRDQLVALKIPDGVSPLSLDALRRSGPLGQ
jgi:outer membrane biogenesis lipoprotein LolB